MKRFETEGLEPELARLLYGVDSQALRLAGNEAAFTRLRAFHETMYDDAHPSEQILSDGTTTHLGRACFSAMSLDGWLIGARYRQTVPGESSKAPAYVVGTASVYTADPIGWHLADGFRNPSDNSLELTIESYDSPRPILSVVDDEPLSPLEKARREIARQEEEERCRTNSIRARIGSNVAWQLLRQDYKTEPLQSTGNLLVSVPIARANGLAMEMTEVPRPMNQEVIDNHG